MKRRILFLLALTGSLLAQPYDKVKESDLSRLHLFWNDREHLTCVALDNTDVQKFGKGYRSLRWEGQILKRPRTGTLPLYLLFKERFGDYCSCASEAALSRAHKDGYTDVARLGYVYARQEPGLKPIILYYSADRRDYVLCATRDTIQAVESAGYKKLSVEGYVYQSREKGSDPEIPPLAK